MIGQPHGIGQSLSSGRRLTFATLALALPLACGGCGATVSLATLGTVFGIGAAAVSTGADVFSLGKLNTAEAATGDAVRLAAEHAAEELDYDVVGGGYVEETDVYEMRWLDAKGAGVTLTIDPRTATLTRLRIDVGLFGNEPTSRLILARIRMRLDRDGSPPEPPSAPDSPPVRVFAENATTTTRPTR